MAQAAARAGRHGARARRCASKHMTRACLHFVVTLALLLTFGRAEAAPGENGEGAAEDAPSRPAPGGDVQLAPVIVDGETLFSVRGVSSYPADRRARDIAARIRAVGGTRGAESLTVEEGPGLSSIVDGRRQRIMGVLEEDARIEKVDRHVLAEVYRRRIAAAIAAYRAARQPALLAWHALYALGGTIALLVAALVGHRIVHRLQARLELRCQRIRDRMKIQTFEILGAEQVWRFLSGLLKFAWVVALLSMAFVYLRYVFALFPWTREAGNRLVAIAIDPLRAMGQGIVEVIPNLVFLAALVVVTRYALTLVRLFFDAVASGTVKLGNFDAEWAHPTYRIVRLLVVVFALVVAYPYVPGSGTDAFKGISLFIGVILSLGSSSLMGNLIAGYSMTYRRTFRLGDRVRIGEHVGDVDRIRLLVTHLRTPKNEEVIVPNSTILSTEVVNFSTMARERGLILHTTVGIGYETPWRQVEAMLLEAAARAPGLLREPPPFVLQKTLGDFCVTYALNVYCDAPQLMPFLYSDLHRNILDVFNEYGVQIMTPAYERDPDRPKVVPKEEWYAAPAHPSAADRTAGEAPSTRRTQDHHHS
jgi:small-conductance mechanosensitive channel